jgi:general L-amino acid transport system substrate-binding protein
VKANLESLRRPVVSALLGLAAIFLAGQAAAATLDDVRARGTLRCGIHTGLAGFAALDQDGAWRGFDADYCRAIAAAIFDDPEAVVFVPLGTAERFAALREGDIDVLARTTASTMARETTLGLNFAGTNFYDGQAFLVPRSLGIASLLELSGASICVQGSTSGQETLAGFFAANHMQYRPVVFARADEAVAAYASGQCLALTGDASTLYALRLGLANPGAHAVLPEIISKEPLGLVVREGDERWFDVVRWVHFALLDAEELGVTAGNVSSSLGSENQDVQRLLGVEGGFGQSLGLSADWAFRVIRWMGNYGEVFERNLGTRSPIGMPRGLNALWNEGGLQYAPAIR